MKSSFKNFIENLEEAYNNNQTNNMNSFLEALMTWGTNTIHDRENTEKELLKFEDEASKYRYKKYNYIFRGQPILNSQLKDLKSGKSITIELKGVLTSWSTSFDVADSFARYNDSLDSAIIIRKKELDVFFDFNLFSKYVMKNFDDIIDNFDLTDPISENEVIVKNYTKSVTVNPNEVIRWFSFDENGSQKSGLL